MRPKHRRRRRRRDSELSSSSPSSLAASSLLAELFASLGHDLPLEAEDLVESSGVPEPSATPAVPASALTTNSSPLDRWSAAIQRALRLHRPKLIRRGKRVPMARLRTEVTPDGVITALLNDADSRCAVEIQLDLTGDGEPRGRCSCPASRGSSFCIHTYALLRDVLSDLHDPHSSLANRVKQFAVGDRETRELLQDLAVCVSKLGQDTDASTLPDVPVTRIIWEIQASDDDLNLVPRVQRPKKRGNGWTKGATMLLIALKESPELLTTEADRGVVAALQERYDYYRGDYYSLDLIQALRALDGHDLVEMDGEPATVRALPLTLQILPRDGDYIARLSFPVEGHATLTVMCSSKGVLAIDTQRRTVFVMPHDKALRPVVSRFMQTPRIPAASLPQVVDHLKQLGDRVGLILPDSEHGPVLPVDLTFVLLLRSNPCGFLECGLRSKDDGNRHFLPGDGPTCYPDTLEGRPVQRERDMASERRRAAELVAELQLSEAQELAPWTWRIVDIDASLSLLDRIDGLVAADKVEVAWDPKSGEPVRVLGNITPQSLRVEVTRKRDWFGIEGTCQTRGAELSLPELLEGIDGRQQGPYTEIRPGEFARISHQLIDQLRKLRDAVHSNRKRLEIGEVAAPILRELQEKQIDVKAPRAWKDCVQKLESAERLDPQLPESFHGTLRDYQLEGYRWLRRLAEWGVGACLADDMGLGKTIQTLAVLLDRQACGPALVIAPTSVGFNWVREAERFAPELKAHLYRETDRADFLQQVGPGDLVVCSYGLALRDAEALKRVSWGTLVLDEAQFIKNAQTKTSKAIRQFSAEWKLALTGTPIENCLSELWSIFRAISPGLLGNWEGFRKKFAAPIERYQDAERREALARVIRPFVLRRTKEEVLSDLPARTETNLHVQLSTEERKRYEQMRRAALGEIEHLVGLPDTSDQRFRILAIITRLRQLACHIGLVDETWEGPSAKLELLVDTVNELKAEGHRALIFSQFTSFLAKIRTALEDAGISSQYLDGSTSATQRRRAVDAFQNGDSDVFLISLKAGGTGLNLTAADYVIHMDPWWNPAVEDQATDRAHRIGQTKPVMVYRMVAEGTIEEQILDLHREKRDLVDSIMDGTQAAAKLSTDELIGLIRGSGEV